MKNKNIILACLILSLVAFGSGFQEPRTRIAGDLHPELKNDERAVFSRPVSIAHDEKRIYVVDAKEHGIHVFSKSGEFLSFFGKKGQGPGEFNHPSDIDAVGDKLYVVDRLNQRIQILDREGRYLGGFSVPFTPDQICVFPGGEIILSHLPLGESGREKMIHCFREDGRFVWKKLDSFSSGDGTFDAFRNLLVLIKGAGDDVHAVHKSDERKVFHFRKDGTDLAGIRISPSFPMKKLTLPLPGRSRNVQGLCWDASFDGNYIGLLELDYTEDRDLGPGRRIVILDAGGEIREVIELPDTVTRIDLDGGTIYAIDRESNLRIFGSGCR